MSCCVCFLLLCYILLWVAAVVFTFVGSEVLTLANAYDEFPESAHIQSAGVCIFVAGVFLFIISVIAVIACCCKQPCLLVFFLIGMLIILGCEIGAVHLCFRHWSEITAGLEKMLRMQLNTYGNDSSITSKVDSIQKTLKCCGVSSYNDWNSTDYFIKNQKYPESCYPPGASMTEVSKTSPLLPAPYSDGCYSMLEDLFHSKSTPIIVYGIIFTIEHMFTLCGSCYVVINIGGG